MKIIGLTGGIGMGKSTAATAFRRAGIPVFDADFSVHQLQAPGGRAVPPIAAAFPDAIATGPRGRFVDRARLREVVLGQPDRLRALERIVHPLVRKEERTFLARARRAGRPLAVLDIPLLFETGGEKRVDCVVVVSAPPAVQIQRVRRRRGMSDADIVAVLARQTPDREKRRRADVVIRTGLSRHHAQRAIRKLVRACRR